MISYAQKNRNNPRENRYNPKENKCDTHQENTERARKRYHILREKAYIIKACHQREKRKLIQNARDITPEQISNCRTDMRPQRRDLMGKLIDMTTWGKNHITHDFCDIDLNQDT